MKNHRLRFGSGSAAAVICGLLCALATDASAQGSISGSVKNQSVWADNNPSLTPPGDGDAAGVMRIGLWNSSSDVEGVPYTNSVLDAGAMPFPYNNNYAYSFAGVPFGNYQLVAWVDADNDGQYDLGEPRNATRLVGVALDSPTAVGVNVTLRDDSDADQLPDWWEAHWFRNTDSPLGYGSGDDPDGDELNNLQEYLFLPAVLLNPADWDSDGDTLDDRWEVDHYLGGAGLVPDTVDASSDYDGDGLSNYQEYLGVDDNPRMVSGGTVSGIELGVVTGSTDDMNPLDIDTDGDLLLDSFESAWYDTAGQIDPTAGNGSVTGVTVSLTIAMADPDQDGLTHYREQSLEATLRQGGANQDKWLWGENTAVVPFPSLFVSASDGSPIRVCFMSFTGADLNFSLNPLRGVAALTNRVMLRRALWTDPTDGSSYLYSDEIVPAGHDTDNDGLPDGWEVEFALDPKDPGMGPSYVNGPFGDPDADGLLNFEEFLGQDGDRSATKPFVNGTGDETNPNGHNWRPDSTYEWRWLLTNAVVSPITDPRVGSGVSRPETLGSALPTASIGADSGNDSDDDGIADAVEINPPLGTDPSSPVHSTDPFIMRSALITSPAGIVIPDPEPAGATNLIPAGVREDMQRRDWTIECLVKLLDNGLNGDLFNFTTALAGNARVVYRLQLSNNVPVLTADINGTRQIITGNALPTNEWIHLAAVWDHSNNNLALYIQGVLFIGKTVFGESTSALMYPATNALAFCVSDGSFVNKLAIDEIRIWGLARTGPNISEYSRRLLPQGNGDDVWLSFTPGGLFYRTNDAVLVNGGTLFDGEPGVVLSNVYTASGSYWIDDGNGIYQSSFDVLLYRGASPLAEGIAGAAVANVRFNDKDGSGGFSRDSLLAYYRFDDGGATIEDFARKAKNSLKDAAYEDYFFGDFGYALPLGGFSLVTNAAAPVLGVDRRASDDSDGDGLPDAWEVVHQLNPLDAGTGGESALGAKDGPYGALGDPDGDALRNVYEFWGRTNPRDDDSDGDGVSDSQEDLDGDNVVNLTEQTLGSRPDLVDTDDDGTADNLEQSAGTSPVDPLDPSISRGARFGGSAADYAEIPLNFKQRLSSWTVEALVSPDTVASGPGTIVRRVVENLPGGSNALNYVLGLEPNGAGGLRAYAGYVNTGGQQSILRGGLVPTGAYTHVAASYNNQTATMVLYVGGTAVASNSTFSLAPPVNGRGGETFVRIGEDIGGLIDEVRIWNVARSAVQITSNTARTVVMTEATLAHYFRFDDGQANTNTFPLGTWHQPAGAQDFTYSADWNQQWRHAARLRGNVTFVSPGGIVPPPSLRVNLLPPEAVALGAQWTVDGGPFNDSGASVDLAAGPHTVVFKSIPGWTSPTNEVVALTNGAVTTITRIYQQNGALLVNLEPAAAVATGAQFRVDGGTYVNSGTLISNLSPGAHSLEFKPVPGWTEPAGEMVTVAAASTAVLTRTYAQAVGYLRVTLVPSNVVAQGAQWRVNGGPWNNSGLQIALQAGGTYVVDYRAVTGWVAPSNETVSIANNLTTAVVRAYTLDQSLTDSDNDGLPDAWEVQYFGGLQQGPTGDPDGDGLTNLQEYQYGTNPTNADTDGDGFSDSVEINRGSDPLNPLSIPAKTIFNDFDGDGATDLVLFWRDAGMWYIRQSSNGRVRQQNWGYSATDPTPADYDGDRKTDISVRDTINGYWHMILSQNSLTKSVSWAWTTAEPLASVPADYDGDNRADICVYRPALGNWYLLPSGSQTNVGKVIQWGWSQAKPVPGDYDGDGMTDIATFYPAGGLWYILSSASGGLLNNKPIQWGYSEVVPVPADYDGDRKTDIAVYHPASGRWYIINSSNGTVRNVQWGWSQALPVPGDYDNDGKADIATYWPTGGLWYILKSSNGQLMGGAPIQFGWSQALPAKAP